ncbi:hypothetical protein ABES02_24935 [Neobacillus pocheonensis]|uniref:hypothetical protein n=1 Tax=Neobacillus pocheonensis TaxID=363869 RepID=UPI003D275159
MYLHIIIAISCWLAGVLIPSLPEKYMVTFMLMGFVALLLFFKDAIGYVNKQFLIQVEEAENESETDLHSFQGKFMMIRDEDSPFSDEFTYLIFQNGQSEVPLFCRNLRIIQKAAMANNELIVYYKNNILVKVEEIE